MIGPILRKFIKLMANNQKYMNHSIIVNEVEETGTAYVSIDSKHTTFIYNADLKKWVEKKNARRRVVTRSKQN